MTKGDLVTFIGVHAVFWPNDIYSAEISAFNRFDEEDYAKIEEAVDELISAAQDVTSAFEWGTGRVSAEARLKKAKEELMEVIRSL